MKKIYSFILTALLLLGAQCAWGSYELHINTTKTSCDKTADLTGSDGVFYAEVNLTAGTTYYVYVYDNDNSQKKNFFNSGATLTGADEVIIYKYGDANFDHMIPLIAPTTGTYRFRFRTVDNYANFRIHCVFPEYTLCHQWGGSGSNWAYIPMTKNNDGTFSCIGIYGSSKCSYKAKNSNNYKDIENANLTITGNPANGDFCTFTLDPMSQTISVAPATSVTTREVSVYVNSPYDRQLYAVDEDGLAYNGCWPGKVSGLSKENDNYKYTFNVLDGKNITLVLNYSYGGNNFKTRDINLGSITTDMSLYYTIDEECRMAYLNENFDGGDQWEQPLLPATINIAHNASQCGFKVLVTGKKNDGDNNIWYGIEEGTTITPTSNYLNPLWENSGNDITLKPTVTGNYTFEWVGGDTKRITVTYPTEYSRSIGSGNWGTICLPVNATISGADLYSINNVSGDAVTVLPEENAHTLAAGVPYFIKGTSATQDITLLNTSYAATAGTASGLIGTYVNHTNVPVGQYMLHENLIYEVGEGCYVDAFYAYLNINPSGSAPSAFRIVEGVNNTTSVETVEASEKAVKFFENGQLFIQKNGVVYDMTGRAVK